MEFNGHDKAIQRHLQLSTKALKFIDAHHHLWDLNACYYPWLMAKGEIRFFGDPSPIQKNYLPADFGGESEQYIPRKSVHIQVGVAQTDSLKESQWLQQQSQFPDAFIAFCDLSSSEMRNDLDAQLELSKLRGFRQILGRYKDEDGKHGSNELIQNPAWLKGLKRIAKHSLSFDLQMIPPQMPELLKVLKKVPHLNIALCHCGSPWDQTPEGLDSWRKGLEKLAELPNVACKVSGLGMFNPHWKAEDLRPIILNCLDIFGPERLMFGSNFPVDKLYRSYQELWQTYEMVTADFSESEKEQMFYQTASDFYRLD